MQVQTPISGINSLIYMLEETPGVSEAAVRFIKKQALPFCLALYKMREFVFCTSPADVALAAFNKGIRDASKDPSLNFNFLSVK